MEILKQQNPPIRGSLNPEQQECLEELVQYCLSPKYPNMLWMSLLGYAGTGKTYTMGQVVRILMQKGKRNIVMSAPTHKAVKEMKRVGPDDIAYSTVHSLLGLKENIDEKTGARSFVPSRDPTELRIDSFDIVIVDEVSMLSAELFKILYGHIRERDELRIIFMGDPVQIPPVKELDSLALLHAEKYHIKPLTLNTIVRQAQGNPILNYATALRGIYKNGYTSPADYTGSNESGKMQVMNKHDNLDTVLSTYFNDPDFVS